MYQQKYLIKTLRNIRNEINNILFLEQSLNVDAIFDPFMKAIKVIGEEYETYLYLLNAPTFFQFSFFTAREFQFSVDEEYRRNFLSNVKKILDFVASPEDKAQTKKLSEKSKGLVRRAWDWLKEIVKDFGAGIRNKIFSFYQRIEAFIQTNPFFAASLITFLILAIVCFWILKDEQFYKKVFHSFNTAFSKVWYSIKMLWTEDGAMPKIAASFELIFMPFFIMYEMLRDQALEVLERVMIFFSAFFIFFLLGLIYYKISNF